MKLAKLSEKKFLSLLLLFNLFLRFFRLDSPKSAYFDEGIFYLKAARSLIETGVDPLFEHPPLAKLIIASSIKIFGDNSLGWRFPSVAFSTLGILLTYLLAKKIFGGRAIPTLSALFLTFEFAWFTMGRLAVPEMFLATFSLASLLFFVTFFKNLELKGKPPAINFLDGNFLLGSVFFGLALATKWSALVLLPVLLLLLVCQKINWKKTALALVLFAAVVSTTYLGSYAMYLQKHSLADLAKLQQKMYFYHTTTIDEIVAHNPKFQELERLYKPTYWPLDNIFSFKFSQTVNSIEAVFFVYNPVVLWGGLIASGYFIWKYIRKRQIDVYLAVLTTSFLLPWLVWLLSPRITYPYYWLSGMPAGAILIAYFLVKKFKKDRTIIYAVAVLATVLFSLYYPLLTNTSVPIWYFRILTGLTGFN